MTPNKPFNILLVEDNKYDVSLLVESFTDMQNGLHVDHVSDGHQALDYVYRRSKYIDVLAPDMILLDLGLPRISGYDVLKQLKNDDRYDDIPITVLTTSCNPLDQSQCMALGANAYLSKPNNLSGYKILARELCNMAHAITNRAMPA